MTDPAVSVKDLLVAGGAGTFAATSGWSIHVGKLPATPNTAISVMQTGGLAPNPKWLLDYPSIQVMVRGAANGYVAARAKAQKVKDILLGIASQDLNGDRLVQINQIGDIASIGFDDSNRPLFTLNFRLIVEPATSIDSNRIAL